MVSATAATTENNLCDYLKLLTHQKFVAFTCQKHMNTTKDEQKQQLDSATSNVSVMTLFLCVLFLQTLASSNYQWPYFYSLFSPKMKNEK